MREGTVDGPVKDTPNSTRGRGSADRCVTAGNALEPLLVPAAVAAEMVGVSRAAWWGYHASGRCPSPVKLGGRTLWRVEELKAWVAADCPPRVKWQGMKGGVR